MKKNATSYILVIKQTKNPNKQKHVEIVLLHHFPPPWAVVPQNTQGDGVGFWNRTWS